MVEFSSLFTAKRFHPGAQGRERQRAHPGLRKACRYRRLLIQRQRCVVTPFSLRQRDQFLRLRRLLARRWVVASLIFLLLRQGRRLGRLWLDRFLFIHWQKIKFVIHRNGQRLGILGKLQWKRLKFLNELKGDWFF